MQDVLTESSERLMALSEESPVMICNVDLPGHVNYVNKKFGSVTGYPREDILGKDVFSRDIWDDSTISLIKERIHTRIVGGIPEPIEVQMICRNKEKIRLSLVAEPIRERGKVTGFQVIGQDITESWKMKEKLLKTEERYRTIFESANDIILLIDEKGNIIDINHKVSNIGGLHRENLIGKNLNELTGIIPAGSLRTILGLFPGG